MGLIRRVRAVELLDVGELVSRDSSAPCAVQLSGAYSSHPAPCGSFQAVLSDRNQDLLVQKCRVVMQLSKYSFAAEKACRSHRSEDGREIWTVTVPVANLPRDLKLGPNAR